jgi:hypothetical protein
MANALPEDARQFYSPEDFTTQIREYVRCKQTIDMMDTRSKELREKLFAALDSVGEEDTNGNIIIQLDKAIDGVVRLEKQRRVSRKLNEALAETLIDEKGLGDTLYETKRVINEEALMAAYYNGDITEEELDEMFPVSVTWALRTAKK